MLSGFKARAKLEMKGGGGAGSSHRNTFMLLSKLSCRPMGAKLGLSYIVNKVACKIIQPQRQMLTKEWRKLHSKKLHIAYFMNKYIKWVGHVDGT